MHSGPSNGSPPLERGLAVGACVLVRPERTIEDEEIWLGRTNTIPHAPTTVRLRSGVPGSPSPFRDEVQLAPWLRHPNLFAAAEAIAIGTWHAGVTPGAPGVPLPELYGVLAGLRAQGEARWIAVVQHIVASMLAGLDAAHRAAGAPAHPRGIVHGAVRPSVVQIGADGVVRVGGFGAIVDDDPSRIADRGADALTYAAPEQFGTRVRAASMDLWAVGAVLHELVDGARFRGGIDDVRALYRVAMAGDVPPLARPAPEPIERLRLWLLAAQPRSRPKSCAEAIAALPPSSPEIAALLGGLVRAYAPPAPEADAPAMAAPPVVAAPMPAPPAVYGTPPPMHAPPAVYGTPPPMPVAPMPVAPMSVAPPMPIAPPMPVAPPMPIAPPMVARLPIPEDEGTVELDDAILAAMRAGTAPPSGARGPQPSHPQQPEPSRPPSELVMPPPAARSSSRSAVPAPRSPAPAQPVPPAAVGPYPGAPPHPGAPQHYGAAPHHGAPQHPGARPPVSPAPSHPPPVRHDPGPLDLHPTYEPTTTTTLRARRSSRNFVVLLVAAAVVAIAVGVTVGYLIVGDGADDTPAKAAPKSKDAPSKPEPEKAAPAGDGPFLQPRAP
jgi:serine/threonine protein kinase